MMAIGRWFGMQPPEQTSTEQADYAVGTSTSTTASISTGTGLSAGIANGSITSDTITAANLAYPWHTVPDWNTASTPTIIKTEFDTNADFDEKNLKDQTNRVLREKRYMRWYFGLRVGETTRFSDHTEMVSRLPHGWLHHYNGGMMFISADEVPVPEDD